MPAPIPLLKIGGLLIRTLSKPLANQMKSWVKTNEPFANFCCYIGQQTHQVLSILNIRAAGLKVVSVKPLPREEAVADGVGYASEVFVFSVATTVLLYEFAKSEASSSDKSRRAKEKEANFKKYINGRFEEIDSKLSELQTQQNFHCHEIKALKQKQQQHQQLLQKQTKAQGFW